MNNFISGNMEATACANSRSNICDTVKGNRLSIAELGSILDKIEEVLETSNCVRPCDEVSADPNCLLADVMLQKEMLDRVHCTVKRIYVSLIG